MTREERIEQRRQQGELLYRHRFEDLGLSEQFEFIKRDWDSNHGNLIRIKCRACGNVFDTWNVYAYFRGKVKNVCCPECGVKSDGTVQWTKSDICDKAISFYLEGHTRVEVAEKFKITETQFDNQLRLLGITKTEEQRKAAWRISLAKASAKSNKLQQERARVKRSVHLDQLGFDLVGTNIAKCRICGCEIERTLSHLGKGNVTCPECARLDRAEKELAWQKEIEERKKRREEERKAKNPLGLSAYQLSIQTKLDAAHLCEVCGAEYTIRKRMEDEGLKYGRDDGCCSRRCLKKRLKKKQPKENHRTRAHKYGCEYDKSVTLKKLIKRNGLRCSICGGMCDPDDRSWTKYFGPLSPTLDHIIPMSKGGGHTWDNVQVAHAICNSKKKDDVEVNNSEAS